MNPLCKSSGKTACQPLLIGSHVGMSGTSMMDGSVQEALSYGANTFMLYTGAPQNTRRKPVDELCIPQAQERMRQNNITRPCPLYHQSRQYRKTGGLFPRG